MYAVGRFGAAVRWRPYILIWFVARGIFEAMPDFRRCRIGTFRLGSPCGCAQDAAIYFGALMCTHLAAFRTARNMRFRAAKHLVDLPLGYFNSQTSRAGCAK